MLNTSVTSNWKRTVYAFQPTADRLGYHCENFRHFRVEKFTAVTVPEKLNLALPSRQELRVERRRTFRLVLGNTPELLPDHGQICVDTAIIQEKEPQTLSGSVIS